MLPWLCQAVCGYWCPPENSPHCSVWDLSSDTWALISLVQYHTWGARNKFALFQMWTRLLLTCLVKWWCSLWLVASLKTFTTLTNITRIPHIDTDRPCWTWNDRIIEWKMFIFVYWCDILIKFSPHDMPSEHVCNLFLNCTRVIRSILLKRLWDADLDHSYPELPDPL